MFMIGMSLQGLSWVPCPQHRSPTTCQLPPALQWVRWCPPLPLHLSSRILVSIFMCILNRVYQSVFIYLLVGVFSIYPTWINFICGWSCFSYDIRVLFECDDDCPYYSCQPERGEGFRGMFECRRIINDM